MTTRTTYTLDLAPLAGYRFQPTGFPNLGAAVFDRPSADGWVKALHVESPQSMANRMEATTWDAVSRRQVEALSGIPYVAVVNADGEFLTSSRLEAHRLASAYIVEGTIDGVTGSEWLKQRLGVTKGAAIDHQRLANAIFELDPLSLVHGVFFARGDWPWQPKIARAVTCFIDADDVRVAASGGVKTDSVDTAGGNTDTGYGMVPHQRIEYTARAITAYLTIDRQQIASYGLNDARTNLLNALIDFEIGELFGSGGLRLRTACDLEVVAVNGGSLVPVDDAASRVAAAVQALQGELPAVHTLQWVNRAKKATKHAEAAN
jgi:CRISPR-associated protein Csb1